MTNAKIEFKEHTKSLPKILCAKIGYYACDFDILLKLNYTESEYEEFVDKLDFTYDSGYGGQELFGTIWYADGSWSSRGEYDGSEWWDHNTVPGIPEYLNPTK